MSVEDTEIISPEDNFDNGLILGYIEKALSSESRLFTKYDHYEIYVLKLSKVGLHQNVSKQLRKATNMKLKDLLAISCLMKLLRIKKIG